MNLKAGALNCRKLWLEELFDVTKVRSRSQLRLGIFFLFLGSANGVKSTVHQCRVLVEILGMIKCACVSIFSVKQNMHE